MATTGKGSKTKGSKFERDVRDELRRIYPADKRDAIKRVPMSGAGWMKGDLLDRNDTSWCYEAKKHEILGLPAWWKQTVRECQATQEPCLVFSSNYRPIYWCVREDQWIAYSDQARIPATGVVGTTTKIYDKLADLGPFDYLAITLAGEDIAVVPNEYFIIVRKALWEDRDGE
jgi:hypothetical protein